MGSIGVIETQFELQHFSQSRLIEQYKDLAEAHQGAHGVCAMLCIRWLSDIKNDYKVTPKKRLQYISDDFPAIIRGHGNYSNLRKVLSREAALNSIGKNMGLEYDPDGTVILDQNDSMKNIRDNIKRDVAKFGHGAHWSLQFTKGRHAIAGFCGITSQGSMIHHMALHIFDPNIGEYVCDYSNIDNVLIDLFNKFSLYKTTSNIARATVTV
jgi:hypothetical protein